ncbi:glycosyltransferase [Metabacillus sp. 84]|uniref:glycosyltransferase n=1 Tax=Metabacillus sp. 84 TaxID=3404705 RepID=UPI003CF5EA36
MKPFISLCMIVKNEEQVIDRCLSTVAHLVDEVIVVDTGSTDHTKLIVAGYTSNIYDFEWINDFSSARNYAASKASGEWIIVLDADEYVDEDNFKSFVKELKSYNGCTEAFSANILNFTGSFGEGLVQNRHDRIYKNSGDIYYYRSIHEQLKRSANEEIIIQDSNLLIFHSGYIQKTLIEKNKNERNKDLLNKEIQESNNAFDYFNYGNEYCSVGDYSKALDSYLKAYKLKKDYRLSWVSVTLVQIIICLIHLQRYNDALAVIKDAESIYSSSPEFLYLKAEIFLLRGQIEDSTEIFHFIVENSHKFNYIILRPDLKDQSPHLRLGEIYFDQGNFTAAINHYSNVLNINKFSENAITKVVSILNEFHSNEEIKNFLQENKLVNSKNINHFVRACLDIGNPDLALSLYDTPEINSELLYNIALLKKICIEKHGDIDNLKEIFTFEVMKDLIKSNWVNVVDLVILKEILKGSEYENIISLFEGDKEFISLNAMLHKGEIQGEINENLFLFSLETFINYNHIESAETLFNYLGKLNESGLSKVAALLYSKGFSDEAIKLYEKVDWNHLSVKDFLNVIGYLVSSKNMQMAMDFSQKALSYYANDFRFYKLVLDNTRDEEVFKNIIEKAKKHFYQSRYLTQYKIT